jgi:hypothetical protein
MKIASVTAVASNPSNAILGSLVRRHRSSAVPRPPRTIAMDVPTHIRSSRTVLSFRTADA